MKATVTILLLSLSTIIYESVAQNLIVEGRAKITVLDTVTNLSSNVVSQADGTLAIREYKTGDFSQGGIIFWIDETGEHGLVVDSADLSTGINWSSNDSTETGATARPANLDSPEGKGAGDMNTLLIVANNPAGTSAAKLCTDLIRGDYGDWYLPSMGELHLMFVNRTAINTAAMANGGTGLASDTYWSSTEKDQNTSWSQSFNSGAQGLSQKSHNHRVRAIRFF